MSLRGSEAASASGLDGNANASAADGTSLATARLRHLGKLLDHPQAIEELPDFHDRLVVLQYNFAPGEANGEFLERPDSNSPSMALSVCTASSVFEHSVSRSRASSNYSPSLDNGSSAKTGSSVRTSRADSLLQNVLETDEDGVLQIPTPSHEVGRLICSFSWLDCRYRSDSLEEWDIHCQHHLRGKLPREAYCPFGCGWTTKCDTGDEAWRERTVHIVARHHDGRLKVESRPTNSLIDHLRRHKIIDDAQKKELVRSGRLTGGVYTISGGALRDDRAHRRRGQLR